MRLFRPLFGSSSIPFTNKADGRTRRTKYDKVFTRSAFKNSYAIFHKVSADLSTKWSTMPDEQHIPLTQHMLALSFKILMWTLVGDYFKDDKKLLEFRKNFDVCWSITEESLLAESFPEEGSQQFKRFSQAKSALHDTLKDVLQKQRSRPRGNDLMFVDMVTLAGISEDTQVEDLLTFIVWGVHKTAFMLSWALYFLATHPDIQQKLVKEISTALGESEVNENNVDKLRYLRQVLDETLRCSALSPWSARVQDFDTELEGHKIPKNTPVIHALGVVLQGDTWWAEPNKFDPDRFSSENTKSRPLLAFSPFGFAGKRTCPGAQLAYLEATSVLVTLLRQHKVKMVEGLVINPVYGIVTHPGDEIWITVEKRK
ncbi:cytochrome P450 20A1-like isoform X1 [Liolophura sinensis]|uniref:cytochrome P450 20A1-like isoform X1 n=1 Tax=Liolophura sinensis TaxID=3198878 RepID=UPI003158319F